MAAGRQSHSFASPTGRLQEDMYFNYGCIFKQHPHLPAVRVHSCCDLCAQAWQWAWLLGHLIAEGSDSLRCLVHILRNVPNACHQLHASGGLLECFSSARIPRTVSRRFTHEVYCAKGEIREWLTVVEMATCAYASPLKFSYLSWPLQRCTCQDCECYCSHATASNSEQRCLTAQLWHPVIGIQ